MSEWGRKPIHKRGDTWDFEIIVASEDGTPLNLTGWTATLKLQPSSGGTVSLTLTPGAGLTITPAEGRIDVLATKTQMAAVPAGSHVWELTLYLASSDYQLTIPQDGVFDLEVEERVGA